jgi:hypothetical protein
MVVTAQRSTFYVLDFDRTLYDTIAGARLLTEVAASYDAKLGEALRIHTDELLVAKTSFSILDFIRDFVGEQVATEIRDAFIEQAGKQDLLIEGTRELLAFIESRGDRAGILTYGSPEGQAVKISASGLSMPHLITSEGRKGRLLASWYKEGSYELPDEYGGRADQLVFVDDKIISFAELPAESIRGYWLRTSADVNAVAPDLSNVREVASLREVIALEAELTKP